MGTPRGEGGQGGTPAGPPAHTRCPRRQGAPRPRLPLRGARWAAGRANQWPEAWLPGSPTASGLWTAPRRDLSAGNEPPPSRGAGEPPRNPPAAAPRRAQRTPKGRVPAPRPERRERGRPRGDGVRRSVTGPAPLPSRPLGCGLPGPLRALRGGRAARLQPPAAPGPEDRALYGAREREASINTSRSAASERAPHPRPGGHSAPLPPLPPPPHPSLPQPEA